MYRKATLRFTLGVEDGGELAKGVGVILDPVVPFLGVQLNANHGSSWHDRRDGLSHEWVRVTK